jgi:hypothetical protein
MAEEESKADKFKRLAESRVMNVMKKLDVLGNCHKRATYEYSEDDIGKVFGALREKVDQVESLFKSKGKPEKVNEFSL